MGLIGKMDLNELLKLHFAFREVLNSVMNFFFLSTVSK